MTESGIVLKHKLGMGAQGRVDGIPIDRVRKIEIEIRDYRQATDLHIRGRRNISLLDISQLLDQRLLGRAAGAGIPLDRALIDHDREGKARMLFRLRHHQLRRLIDRVTRTVPVDDYAINASADHVRDLAVNLGRIGGTIADVDVPGAAPPEQQVRVNLGRRPGIEQRTQIHFADVVGSKVAIRERVEGIGRACVVAGQCA